MCFWEYLNKENKNNPQDVNILKNKITAKPTGEKHLRR
jgi:hypothetical protein